MRVKVRVRVSSLGRLELSLTTQLERRLQLCWVLPPRTQVAQRVGLRRVRVRVGVGLGVGVRVRGRVRVSQVAQRGRPAGGR